MNLRSVECLLASRRCQVRHRRGAVFALRRTYISSRRSFCPHTRSSAPTKGARGDSISTASTLMRSGAGTGRAPARSRAATSPPPPLPAALVVHLKSIHLIPVHRFCYGDHKLFQEQVPMPDSPCRRVVGVGQDGVVRPDNRLGWTGLNRVFGLRQVGFVHLAGI